MAKYTALSTLLNRMDRWTTVSTIEEQYKVRDLDEAIRYYRRTMTLPWALKKSTLRVFKDILEYPVASDHDELAYVDNQQSGFEDKARLKYTSIKDFYEDPDNRNDIAEIFDQGTRYLGIRYEPNNSTSTLINNAETAANFSVSDDATAVVLDQVVFKEGNGSMKVSVTNSAGTATIENSSTSHSDSNLNRKYYFRWVYLDSAPTSITLRYGSSNANYLYATVTTQFAGQAFKADDWNLVGMDLNTASEQGTVDKTALDYEAIVLTGAATGTYYIDASYTRSWELMDYWYYSSYQVRTVGQSVPNQEYFFNSIEAYSTDSEVVGDDEWTDLIVYEALINGYADKENSKVLGEIKEKRDKAYTDLLNNYPSLRPMMTTNYYRFDGDYFPLIPRR